MLTRDQIRALPKVALHEHLDGALRPATMLELAADIGYQLPASVPEQLDRWFVDAADSGSLVRYLETFAHTVAVMQTADQLRRVAREFVEDSAADGVVYIEARWAPEQHLAQGLTPHAAVLAVRDGLAEGMAAAAADGRAIVARQILTSLRHGEPTTQMARLAIELRDEGVAGFDLAGAEDGFPPSRFREACETIRRANGRLTIHAGEAYGPDSIWEALQLCGAHRIEHGVRIVEDIADAPDGTARLGTLAAYVRDLAVPLEVCPSSNLQTGIAATVAEHPFGRLADLGFNVTVSCDNRLMSGTTLSREFALLSEAFGYGVADLRRFTVAAAEASFQSYDERRALLADVIEPGFAAALAS